MDELTTPVLVAGTIQTSFKFFSRLPAELQLIVWESAVSNLDPYVATMYKTGSLCSPKTPTGVLSLLHTCTTSRKVALKKYKPLFTTLRGNPVYFNSSKDIFYVTDIDTYLLLCVLGLLPPLYKWDYDQVKHLAIGIDDFDLRLYKEDVKNWLAMMGNLKNVAFLDKVWYLSHEFWKDAREIQSHWKMTQGLFQIGIEGKEKIEPPQFHLMILGQYPDRYSEEIKQKIKLALGE
jgi:hypothetical protein